MVKFKSTKEKYIRRENEENVATDPLIMKLTSKGYAHNYIEIALKLLVE